MKVPHLINEYRRIDSTYVEDEKVPDILRSERSDGDFELLLVLGVV